MMGDADEVDATPHEVSISAFLLDKYLVTPDHLIKLLREAFMQVMKDPEVDKDGDKFFGDGWKAYSAEKIEAVIREHVAIPKEARDYILKLRQKYNLPIGETK